MFMQMLYSIRDVHKGGIKEEEFSEVSLTQGWHRGGEFSEVSLTTMCKRVESRRRSSPRLVLHKGGIGRGSSLRLVLHNVHKGGIKEEEFSEVSLTQHAEGLHQGGGVLRG